MSQAKDGKGASLKRSFNRSYIVPKTDETKQEPSNQQGEGVGASGQRAQAVKLFCETFPHRLGCRTSTGGGFSARQLFVKYLFPEEL